MRTRFSMVRVLFRNELRMILRDKRSVLASIVLPILLMPIILFASTWTTKQRDTKLRRSGFQYAVGGSQTNEVRQWLELTRSRLETAARTNETRQFRFEERRLSNPLAALTNREIHLVVEGFADHEAALLADRGHGLTDKVLNSGAPVLRISYRADRDDASVAAHQLENELIETRGLQRQELLEKLAVPMTPQGFLPVTTRNLAEQRLMAGLALGRMLPGMLLLFMLIAGAVVATDLVAGEKERGTLETLLTTGADRLEVVLSKHLVILTVTIAITLIQTANLLIYVSLDVIPMPQGWAAAATPGVLLLLLWLFLPVAALVASVLLLTSGYAKTYKEAQLYFTPVLLLMLLPGLAPLLPELPLRSAIALAPLANLTIGVREVLTGVYDWPLLVTAWCITAGTAAWILRLTVGLLNAERLVTAAERTEEEFIGGPALFRRRVVQWFLILWACLLLVGNHTAEWDLRLQVLINIGALFLGMSLLMVRVYRLEPQKVFALRAPKPAVWLAVLAAAPCGMLAGTGIFVLADRVFPVPPEILEGFSQSLLPGTIPLWQMLLFLAVVPGIVEELAFRGVLLNGLSTRLRPIPLILVVGLTFGLFHGALFRIAPTAFLGVMLATTTLLTGSIFPAMIWHALNNTLSLLAGVNGLPLSELSPAWYWFGAAGLAAAFWIFWTNRTPYPGLKTWSPSRRTRQTDPLP